MTIYTQIYAQKRREAEVLVRQCAPPSSHAKLVALLQPAIALHSTPMDDAHIALGASKFGGAPDVPDGFVWPRYQSKSLGFLAQINLREVAFFDIEKQLPATGNLLFFAALDQDNPVWGEPEQREGWLVMWAREPLHRATRPADAHWIVAQSTQRVSFDADWTLDNTVLGNLGLDEDDWCGFQSEVLEKTPHRMLGCPYAPQLSPLAFAANGIQGKSGFELYDESVATSDWQLLLQLNTASNGFFEDIHDVG